jgi:hypothetical protein
MLLTEDQVPSSIVPDNWNFFILVHIDQILAFMFLVKLILMAALYYLFDTGSFVGNKEAVSRLEGNGAYDFSLYVHGLLCKFTVSFLFFIWF